MIAEEPTARLDTGVRGRSLIVEGWFASHADRGRPGPHVHLRTSDRGAMVVRTDQVPDVVAALRTVAERIERSWSIHGSEFAESVRDSPDPNDPVVARRLELADLDFHDRVAARLPELVAAFLRAESTDEAIDAAVLLLDVTEGEAFKLATFNLFAMTRAAQDRRAERRAELEGS